MTLGALLARRLLAMVPTLVGVSLLAFALIRLAPGDPVMMMLGERGGSPEAVAEMRANLGLDRPLFVQYGLFLGRAVKGDFGQSIVSKRSVWEEFRDRFPATLELALAALLLACVLGIPAGVIAAVQRGRLLDRLLMSSALVGYSFPIFWWGLILILVFSVKLGLTPVSGRMSLLFDIPPRTGLMLVDVWLSGQGFSAFKEALRHLLLPTLALATVPLAAIARMTRSSLLEVLREDYIRTARAKGLSRWAVVVRHALRNALVPIVTVVGLMGGTLLTGAILTESVFAWPGLGRWIATSVTARDYPVIQGGILLLCLLIMMVNLLVDAVYLYINPLMRDG